MPKYLGIEIGGTKLQVAAGDESGIISLRRKVAVERDRGAAGIRAQLEKTVGELRGGHEFGAVGVGFGGPVEWKTGRICRSHQIEGWSGFELAAWLRGLTGAPVFADNDANVAALGEAHCGAGVGFDPVFYVTLGSGVGGGLVAGGRVYHGAAPGESEIGHVRLDRNGTTVESRCSGWAVDARIRQLKAADSTGVLGGMLGDEVGGEARHLASALERGDPAAGRILRETAEDLAFGLSHAVHLFHPEIIILGGGLSEVGEPLRAAVELALPGMLMEVFAPGPKLALARLGEDAVPAGALLLAAAGGRGA